MTSSKESPQDKAQSGRQQAGAGRKTGPRKKRQPAKGTQVAKTPALGEGGSEAQPGVPGEGTQQTAEPTFEVWSRPRLELTRRLGIAGWRNLDAILLASIASETPLLLIGTHGTAKSLMVERMATSLGQRFRHYNASLINYDDLVGIPYPEESGAALKFIASDEAVWDAEFVFFDEISRCRADLQNKLFPIIHERKVLGKSLDRLRHRWAAMNPPFTVDVDGITSGDAYTGSEELDAALVDRFGFIITVPDWKGLDEADRYAVVRGGGQSRSHGGDWLASLAFRTRILADAIVSEAGDFLSEYVVLLMGELAKARINLSARRAHQLFRNIAHVHAASCVLGGEEIAFEASIFLAVVNSLPGTATSEPPNRGKVLAAHRQSLALAQKPKDDPMRIILQLADPIQRIETGVALGLPPHELGPLITRGVSSIGCPARRIGVATALFMGLQGIPSIPPSVWEPIGNLAQRVIRETGMEVTVRTRTAGNNIFSEITKHLSALGPGKGIEDRLTRNFLVQGTPDLWAKIDWRQAEQQFRDDFRRLGALADAWGSAIDRSQAA